MKNLIARVIVEPLREVVGNFLDFLPNLLTGIVVFVIGLLVAWGVKALATRISRLTKLDRTFARAGAADALQKLAVKDTPSQLVGRMFFWLVTLIFFILALTVMKVPVIDELLKRLFLYLPNIFVALIVLVIGLLVGNFLGRAALIAAVNAGIKTAAPISRIVKGLVLAFALVMAFEQLGVGRETMITAFAIAFGGLVLALALAFGLGGRDRAKDLLDKKLRKEGPPGGPPDDLKHL